MEAIILRTKFFVPFLLVIVVSTLRHPRNLAENKQSNGVGNRAGIITLVFAAKKKHYFGFRTFPETRPSARDKNGTPTSVALATINSSSSCHRHTKQTRRQGLRIENLLVNHRTRGEGEKPKENRAKKKKEKKTLFSSQASTLPHAALVTMVCNSKKEEP